MVKSKKSKKKENAKETPKKKNKVEKQTKKMTITLTDKRKRNIILADPPWAYSVKGMGGCADTHYNTEPSRNLETLNVEEYAADDCILLMWTTSPKMAEAIRLLEAWGFKYKTMFAVWIKTLPTQLDDPHAMGFYTRQNVEYVIMGSRGNVEKFRKLERKFVATAFTDNMREHSRKPEHLKKMIDTVFEDVPKLELFARESKDLRWDTWGNETGKFGGSSGENKNKEKKMVVDEQHKLAAFISTQKRVHGKIIDKMNRYGTERNGQKLITDFIEKMEE
jgi:N6-adenosine-specific RNA methylase IME4